MTTIDIKFSAMSKQEVSVRISQAGGKRDDARNDHGKHYSGRMSPAGGRLAVGKSKKAGREYKSPSKKSSAYSGAYDVFTITAYLPGQDSGDVEKRLKLTCSPGETVRQVIEKEIPQISRTAYQVYQFPSRALLNPAKDASVLQDQEIWIEPTHVETPEDTLDERLTLVKDLLRSEDAYLEHLRNIFDVYMEPLRTWGMPQSDMNTLFRSLSRLCDLLMNFFSELELAVKSWNTHTTLIGGIFTQYGSFWDMYVEYNHSNTIAMRLLKKKRQDDSFGNFLEIKRGAAMHTLESLMMLPVQRVSEYHNSLSQLLALTPLEHPDHHHLQTTVARMKEIIKAREEELLYLENESKLEQVQIQFPQDNLCLNDHLDNMMVENMGPTHKRSRSQTMFPIKGGGGEREGTTRESTTPQHHHHRGTRSISSLQHVHGKGQELTDGAGHRSTRMYIQEGPMRILEVTKQGLTPHDRYLFMFSDLLIVAKPANRSRAHHRYYRRKQQHRLAEMWISDVQGTGLPRERCSFLLGWPTVNVVAQFSSQEEKRLWYELLSIHIDKMRMVQQPSEISIRVLNHSRPNNSVVLPEFTQAAVSENAMDVMRKALDNFQITDSPITDFQLSVKVSKDDKEEILNGYESPFAIQTYHNRLQMDLSGDGKPQQLDFILRRKPSSGGSSVRPSLIKRMFTRSGGNNEKRKKSSKIFGVSLDEIIINHQLPEVIQEVLVRLWVEGPHTFGIFRQGTSVKKVKELKDAIDNRLPVDISEVHIHVLGALLKDLLRNVPGGVLSCARYTEFVASNDIPDPNTRAQHIKNKVLLKLPNGNQVFLHYLFPLLHHISSFKDVNQMSTTNLAICFAPSLLWPDSSLDVIKNEVPVLVDFMITHAMCLYDDQLPELYKQVENIVPVDLSEETTLRKIELIPLKTEDEVEGKVQRFGHRRDDSMDTSASEMDSVDEEEDDEDIPETVSDSQLIGHEGMLPDKIKRRTTPAFVDDNSDMEDDEGPVSPFDGHPMWRRVDSAGSTNRTNVYSTRVRHRSGDSLGGRRRSIAATQLPTSIHYSPEMQPIMGSSHSQNSSMSSSSQGGYSPSTPHHTTTSSTGDSPYRTPHSEPAKRSKQTSTPAQSSYHDRSYNAPRLTHQSSASPVTYYDQLLPKDTSRIPRVSDPLVRSDDHVPHPSRASNHSISSRSSSGSSEHRPHSRTSVTPKGSGRSAVGSSRGRKSASPDPLAELANTPLHQMDREFIKQAISHRFGISSVDFPQAHERRQRSHTHHEFISSSSSSACSKQQPPLITKGLNILGEDEPETKVVPRKSGGQLTEYPYRSSSAMRPAGSSKVDVDDRPEAEQHLLSLPRRRPDDLTVNNNSKGVLYGQQAELVQVGLVSPRDSQMTLASGGYNSDTESSPSRTLSRQREKMMEVTSPGLSYGRPARTVKQPYPMDLSKTARSTNEPATRRQKQVVEIHPNHKPVFTPSYPTESRGQSSSAAGPSSDSNRAAGAVAERAPQKIRMQRKGSEGRVEMAKIKLGLVQDEEAMRPEPGEERVGQPAQEKRQVWEELSKNISRAQIRETSRTQRGTRQEMTPSYAPHAVLQVSSDHSRKARSMPNYNRSRVVRASSSPHVKTVRVVKYELPTVMKTRRINMTTYNKV